MKHLTLGLLSSLTFSLAFAALMVTPANANAEVKIATVDIARILNESSEALGKKKDLDALSGSAKKKAEDRRKTLQDLETKLKAQKVSEDSKEAENFRNEMKDYARFVKDTEEDLKKKFLKVNKEITDKVLKRITEYAKEEDIDLVLDKSEAMKGPVLYGSNTIDITSPVLDGLDG